MRRRWSATAAAAVVMAVGVVGPGAPGASASCIARTFTLDAADPVGRGETIEITGAGWGDNCYDTGPPPEGQGALGLPLADIHIGITQGDQALEVATVDADDEYGFVVDVVVPADLEPGAATVVVSTEVDGAGASAWSPDPAIVVSDADPVTPVVTTTTLDAGSDNPDIHHPDAAEDSDRSVGSWLIVGAAVLLVAGVLIVVVRTLNRSD